MKEDVEFEWNLLMALIDSVLMIVGIHLKGEFSRIEAEGIDYGEDFS